MKARAILVWFLVLGILLGSAYYFYSRNQQKPRSIESSNFNPTEVNIDRYLKTKEDEGCKAEEELELQDFDQPTKLQGGDSGCSID